MHTKVKSMIKVFKPKYLLIPSLLFLVTFFLFYAPAGLLGKADAIGYAVCHRIPTRSFYIGDRQLPLCVRCTGMHLGAFIGFLYQLQHGKRGRMPSKKFMVLLGIFLLSFAIDGVNSYLHLFPKAPWVYEPQNWLRLLTGTGLGIGIAAILYPTFNQTIWKDWIDEPVLHSWKQIIELMIIITIFYFLTLSDNILILYPVALVTSLNVIIILTTIYTIISVLISRKENSFFNIKDIMFNFIAGLFFALLQILLMDMARYNLTGTWGGFF